MSKYSGTQFTNLYVDGYNLAPSLSEAVEMGEESITQETNPFGALSLQTTPVGIEKGILSIGNGFFDAVVDPLNTAIAAVVGIVRVISASIFGNTIGKPFIGFEGPITSKYKVIDKRDGLVMANVEYLVSGNVEEGVIVQNAAAFTADWDTKTGGAGVTDAPVDYTLDPANRAIAITANTLANPTVVTTAKAHGRITGDKIFVSGSNSTPSINGLQTVTVISSTTFSVPVNVTTAGTAGSFVLASTNAGGAGYLHVIAYSGFSSVVHKIMHSPDDTTYAALITFTTNTAIGKERKTVAGVIDRYLAADGDVTGAGSVTPFMGFSRN